MSKVQYKIDNLYQLVERNCKKSKSKVVIYEEDLKITNIQFKKHIDSFAYHLTELGVKPQDKVALITSNTWKFIVAFFAINKVGGIAVPINNFLKKEEINYILNDSDSKFLVCSNKFEKETASQLGSSLLEAIIWLEGNPLKDSQNLSFEDLIDSEHNLPANYQTLEDTAVIVYTSGTTGRPKGAMLSNRNIFADCKFSLVHMGIKEDGFIPMICYLPMFHAFTLMATVILPIYNNCSITVIRTIASKKDFKNLLKLLLIRRCPFFCGVPDVFSAISKAKLPWYFHWFHNVKGFVSGAAPLAEEISKRFRKEFKRGTLIEGYGITECSPIVSFNEIKDNRLGSVGRPLPGTFVKIVDENMQPVATGVVGEICIKGDNVMQGYYKRPEETSEAIVDGWFRTGDLGRVDKDDFIYIVDRKKDLIISKGMNIYPREIEEVIYTHPKVNACAVVGLKDIEANETPMAYVELKENETATEAEIKDFLKNLLAPFKQPRKIFVVEKLPRNATGKILKRELRDELNKK